MEESNQEAHFKIGMFNHPALCQILVREHSFSI